MNETEKIRDMLFIGANPAKILWHNGQPCSHPGCLYHISHNCEVCGRKCCRGTIYQSVKKGEK
jgi:hypothetical protein